MSFFTSISKDSTATAQYHQPPLIKKNQTQYKGTATTTVTATDEAGNITSLTYTYQLPLKDKRIAITPISISYNGATTTLFNTTFKYKWKQSATSTYSMFAAYITNGVTSTESHYRPKKNITILMTKPTDIDDNEGDDDADQRPTKVKLPGLVIPHLTTQKGIIISKY